MSSSRKLSFRCGVFPETGSPVSVILGNLADSKRRGCPMKLAETSDKLHRNFAKGQGLPFVGALASRTKIHLLFSEKMHLRANVRAPSAM